MNEQGARKAQSRFGRFMKEPSFDSTPEFQHFWDVMRTVLPIPRARLDELLEAAKEHPMRTAIRATIAISVTISPRRLIFLSTNDPWTLPLSPVQ